MAHHCLCSGEEFLEQSELIVFEWWQLRGNLCLFSRETNRCRGACGSFSLVDAAHENAAKPARRFIVQAKVRVLFHHVEGVSKLIHEVGIGCRIHNVLIVASGPLESFIAFLQSFLRERP